MAKKRTKTELTGAATSEPSTVGYVEMLAEIKSQIQTTRIKAATTVNRQLIRLYWEIGKSIVRRQEAEGWGKAVVEQLSMDLKGEFPEMTGLSVQNLWYMRAFFRAWTVELGNLQQPVGELKAPNLRQPVAEMSIENLPQPVAENGGEKLQQPVGETTPKNLQKAVADLTPEKLSQPVTETALPEPLASIPWGHNLQLLHKLKDPTQRLWYAVQTIEHGWSRAVLIHQIESDAYARQGQAITSFQTTLPQPQSDLAQQLIKDPYNFDFLGLTADVSERELEKGLIDHLRTFLIELGKGFAFVGQQYHLEVAEQDYYIDLLFYHVPLGCYFVIDLKVEDFKPEFAGKMSFYLTAVDESLPNPTERPAIGLILCKHRNKTVVEYTLRDATKPIGVATYSMVPPKLANQLPTAEELQTVLSQADNKEAS